MKLIFYSCLFAKVLSYVVLAGATGGNTLPYKVVGIKCHTGEHCSRVRAGKYKGYYLKSNIPLSDNKQSTIRQNMFTKAVLKKEIAKCLARTDVNPVSETFCRPLSTRPNNPYKYIDMRCSVRDLYCSELTEGRYAGLVERSNMSPFHPRFASMGWYLTPEVRKSCIQRGQSICSVQAIPANKQYLRVATRCGPNARYCKRISGGRYMGLIKKSNVPFSQAERSLPLVVSPNTVKCRPQLAYVPGRGFSNPALNSGEARLAQQALTPSNRDFRLGAESREPATSPAPSAETHPLPELGQGEEPATPPPNKRSSRFGDWLGRVIGGFIDGVMSYFANGGITGMAMQGLAKAFNAVVGGGDSAGNASSNSSGLNDPGGLDGGSAGNASSVSSGHHPDLGSRGGDSPSAGNAPSGLNDKGGLDGGSAGSDPGDWSEAFSGATPTGDPFADGTAETDVSNSDTGSSTSNTAGNTPSQSESSPSTGAPPASAPDTNPSAPASSGDTAGSTPSAEANADQGYSDAPSGDHPDHDDSSNPDGSSPSSSAPSGGHPDHDGSSNPDGSNPDGSSPSSSAPSGGHPDHDGSSNPDGSSPSGGGEGGDNGGDSGAGADGPSGRK